MQHGQYYSVKTKCNEKQRQTEAELAGPSNAVKNSKKYKKIANIQ